MEIVKFYQEARAEAGADVWETTGAVLPTVQYTQLLGPQSQQTPDMPEQSSAASASPRSGTMATDASLPGGAPGHREKKNAKGEINIVKRLQAICTDADPTKLYRNLVKIMHG